MRTVAGIFFILHLVFSSFAQNIEYARSIISILASDTMYGRGYVNAGLEKAADFIANEFANLGLHTFDNSYFQHFSYLVNSFPGSMKLSVNGQSLHAGADYIVAPYSGGLGGSYKALIVNDYHISSHKKAEKLKRKSPGKVLVLKLSNNIKPENYKALRINNPKAAAIVIPESGKLVWSVSSFSTPYPTIYIKEDRLPERITAFSFNIENQMHKSYNTANVIAYITGVEYPDSFIVFTGHYDHLGMMGLGAVFPGANDNASGIALMLDLASYFQNNPQAYSIAFIALTGEEAGLKGSFHYVANPLFELSRISFLVNLDLAGTGDDGITVVNATEFPSQFALMDSLNTLKKYLPRIVKRGEAAISDHYPFYAAGVPCFYSYTMGGISEYHNIYDKAETLPLTAYENYFRLLRDFSIALMVGKQ